MVLKKIKNKEISYREVIKSIPFLKSLKDEELAKIERFIRVKSFSTGETILSEDETLKYMYIVFDGKIKVVQVGLDGSEQIIAIHSTGSFFGEMALLDGKTVPATVIAMEDSVIGMIYKDDFETYLLKNEKIQMEIYKMLCSRLRDAWMKLRILRFTNAEQRVRITLHMLGLNHGKKLPNGILIPIKLTHKDIAAMSSLSRETVTRNLVKMQKAGEIEVLDKKKILIKPTFYKKLL